MVKERSSPPPLPNTEDFENGLQHLAQHNAMAPYPLDYQHPYFKEEGLGLSQNQQTSCIPFMPHSQGAVLGPVDGRAGLDDDGSSSYHPFPELDQQLEPNQHEQEDPHDRVGLGIQYVGDISSPLANGKVNVGSKQNERHLSNQNYQEQTHGANYSDGPFLLQSPQGQRQPQSPPTPATSDNSNGTRRTRSGRLISQPELPQDKNRVTKSPQNKKAKKEKLKMPKLTAPLSELTKSYDNVPVRDMALWVNRPPEVRWREVETRKGYVPRPMNSFMLYRSAYSERTKIWCLQNNHQVVSSVSGESWPLESKEIRDKYNNFAKIERDNHQSAHPGYKFSPSKSNNSKKRKTGHSEAEESELSELDGLDYDWSERGGRPNRSKASKRSGRGAGQMGDNPAHDSLRTRPLYYGSAPNSSYETPNPGRPIPSAMEPHDLYRQYYQTPMYPNMTYPYMEDMGIQRTETPASNQSGYHGLVGLPGAFHQELYSHGSSANTPAPLEDSLVDPTLLAPINGFSSNPSLAHQGQGTTTEYNGLHSSYDTAQGTGSSYGGVDQVYTTNAGLEEYAGLQTGDNRQLSEYSGDLPGSFGHNDQWPGKFDVGSEFEKWYDQEH